VVQEDKGMAQKQSNRCVPLAPTAKEIKELAANRELTDMWCDLLAGESMEEVLREFYIVKFNFMNAFPGYCGDLFIIQPNYLAEEVRAVRVIRAATGKLVVVPEEINKGLLV
jgi:hypothetical protein